MKKDPTIKQRKMQEISAKINNTAKEKLSHLPKVCSKFFYRTCVFRRASVCTSDPRNVLRVTAVLSSRSRKPELELDSSDCICLEVICLSVTILQPALIQDGSCCYCCRLIFRGGSKSQKVNRFLPNIFWPNRRCCHCLISFYTYVLKDVSGNSSLYRSIDNSSKVMVTDNVSSHNGCYDPVLCLGKSCKMQLLYFVKRS